MEGASKPIVHDAGVDFVRHHPAVISFGLRGDVFQVCRWDDAAGRVGWRVQDDEFGPLVDEIVERIQIERELILFQQRNRHWNTACHFDHSFVGRETGIGIDDLVARLDQCQGREEQVGLAARADHHFIGMDFDPAPATGILGQSLRAATGCLLAAYSVFFPPGWLQSRPG